MSYSEYLAELTESKHNDAAIDGILARVDMDEDITEDEWSLLCDHATELYARYDVFEQGEIMLPGVLLDTICEYYDLGFFNNIDKVKEALKNKFGDKAPMIKEGA